MIGDSFEKRVYGNEGIHVSCLHCCLQEVLDAKIFRDFLLWQTIESVLRWNIGKLRRKCIKSLILWVGKGLKVSVMVSIVYLFCAVEVFLLFIGVLDLREDVAAFFILLHWTCRLLASGLLLVLQIQHYFAWGKWCFCLLVKLDIGFLGGVVSMLQEVSALIKEFQGSKQVLFTWTAVLHPWEACLACWLLVWLDIWLLELEVQGSLFTPFLRGLVFLIDVGAC